MIYDDFKKYLLFFLLLREIKIELTCSISKSHSGEGERKDRSAGGVPWAGDPCGSSGITAKRPLCKIGEIVP